MWWNATPPWARRPGSEPKVNLDVAVIAVLAVMEAIAVVAVVAVVVEALTGTGGSREPPVPHCVG